MPLTSTLHRVEIPVSYPKGLIRYISYAAAYCNGVLGRITTSNFTFFAYVSFDSAEDLQKFNRIYEGAMNGKISKELWNQTAWYFGRVAS